MFFADDFAYYWFHRAHHEIRILWACHVVHHSSRIFNFSTALRQPWTPMTGAAVLAAADRARHPAVVVFLQQSVNLVYQFLIHTERIDRCPGRSSSSSTPRRTTASTTAPNARYLDRNYGGILIVWDRLFRSFEPERARASTA